MEVFHITIVENFDVAPGSLESFCAPGLEGLWKTSKPLRIRTGYLSDLTLKRSGMGY